MDAEQRAAAVLRDGGLVALPGEIVPREGRGWLVDWQGTRGVLRHVPLPAADAHADAERLIAGVEWLHACPGQAF
jgi:hypothetical protein